MTFARLFSALSLFLLFSTAAAFAQAETAAAKDWSLDSSGSEVSFVTVKASDIAEAHTLGELSGGVSFGGGTSGEVNLSIDLASVETNIPIRNERMREFLFEVARFPVAKIHGHIPAGDFLNLSVGNSTMASLPLMLDMHGVRIPVTAEVLALRVAEDRLMVTSTKPIIINAASVGLVAGIDKLQQLASLPSISKAVPVSFLLNFER